MLRLRRSPAEKERHVSSAENTSTPEEMIKTRAYAIWEDEGRPDGKHLEHWRRASEEMSGAAPPTAPADPAPRKSVRGKA
jgi:Protein of unknown function (DUF2934)